MKKCLFALLHATGLTMFGARPHPKRTVSVVTELRGPFSATTINTSTATLPGFIGFSITALLQRIAA
jgi:hypothetical protein